MFYAFAVNRVVLVFFTGAMGNTLSFADYSVRNADGIGGKLNNKITVLTCTISDLIADLRVWQVIGQIGISSF